MSLIIDLLNKYIFAYAQRVLKRAEVLFFLLKTPPLLLVK